MPARARPPVSSRRNRRAVATVAVAAAALAAVPGVASAAIHVENAKSLKATQGVLFDHQRVVAFDEAGACNAGTYTITVAWGDGTTSPGAVVKALQSAPGTCSYEAEGSHAYAQSGNFTVTVTICHQPECVTTPVGGQANVAAAASTTTAPPEPAAAAVPEAAPAPADQPAAAPPAAAPVATPTLRVLGPVTLSRLRHGGLRLRLSAGAVTARTLTVLLADPATGRTLGRARVHADTRGAAAGADTTLRVRFPRKALRHLRHGHRYGLVIPRGAGLPSLATAFRVA